MSVKRRDLVRYLEHLEKAQICFTTKESEDEALEFHSSCPSFAAHRAACLAGVSPAAGIDCMPA